MSRTIAVFGGNGFLGRRICQQGIQSGYKVIAFSRSGAAPALGSHHDVAWSSKVSWQKADIFNPDTYRKQLADVDAVVHSIGILFENLDYKPLLETNINPWEDLKSLVQRAQKGPNPMTKTVHNTYGAIQRDAAIILADALLELKGSKSAPPAFVYILADRLIPGIPSGYLSTKREAEAALLSRSPDLRTIAMRPGFMYDEQNPGPLIKRNIVKGVIGTGSRVKEMVFGNSVPLLNNLVRPPVLVQRVAQTIYEKLNDALFSGVVPLEEINR